MSKKQFSIRPDDDTYKRLDDYRWKHRKTLNAVVVEALKEFFNNKDKETDVSRQ